MTTPPADDPLAAVFDSADFSGTGNADWSDEHIRIGLAAVRAALADNLEAYADHLRGGPFRRGDVDIAFINGIEAAADRVRTGELRMLVPGSQ